MQKGMVKGVVLDIVRALLVALIFNVVAVLVAAVAVKYAGISDTASTVVNQVVKVLSVAVGALVGFRSKRLGWLSGLLLGLLYTVVGFAVFSLMSGKSLVADATVFDFLLGAASGLFAGILAVNLRSIERKPRTKRLRHAR